MAENPPSERVFLSELPAGLDDAKFRGLFAAYGSIKDVKFLPGNCAICNFASVEEAMWVVENLNGNMPEGISTPIGVKFAKPSKWAAGPQGSRGGPGAGGMGSPAAGGAQEWAPGRPSPYGKGGGCCGGLEKGSGKGGSIQMIKNNLINMDVLPGGKSSKDRSDAQQLYLRGLPPDTDDGDLREIFGGFGAIPARGVKAMLDNQGRCTGIGFVDYIDAKCAAKAVQALNGAVLPDGSALLVNQKNTAKGKGAGKGALPASKGAVSASNCAAPAFKAAESALAAVR